MTNYDWMNPQYWMSNMNETARTMYDHSAKNMQRFADQTRQTMDQALKNCESMNEEWMKNYRNWTDSTRKTQENLYQSWQQGVSQMTSMMRPQNDPTPSGKNK